MRRWNFRLLSLFLLCGAMLYGLYQTGRHRLENSLTHLLGSRTHVGSINLNSQATLTAASNIEIDAKQLAGCTIGRLHFVPSSQSMFGPNRIARAVGENVNLENQDAWSIALKNVHSSIASIDPIAPELPSLARLNVEVVTQKTLAPILASWRQDWQNVLSSYEKQLEDLAAQANPNASVLAASNNPLRDRELIKSHMESIGKLSHELERLEQEMKTAHDSLAQQSERLIVTGKDSLSQQLQEQDKALRQQQRQRLTRNLESLRKQLFASLLAPAIPKQHIVSNLALRTASALHADATVPAERGSDFLTSTNEPSRLAVDCLELVGVCDAPDTPTKFLGAFYQNQDLQSPTANFVVVVQPEPSASTRFTGEIDTDGTIRYRGLLKLSNEPQSFRTDLLTEPNFELVCEPAQIDLQTNLDQNSQHTTLTWTTAAITLRSVVQDPLLQPSLEIEPLTLKDCTATLTVDLKLEDVMQSAANQQDSFFSTLHRQAVESFDRQSLINDDMMVKQTEIIKQSIASELINAQTAFARSSTKLASSLQAMTEQQSRLAAKLQPTQIRTATGTTAPLR